MMRKQDTNNQTKDEADQASVPIDPVFRLLREASPLPLAPDWMTVQTVARLHRESRKASSCSSFSFFSDFFSFFSAPFPFIQRSLHRGGMVGGLAVIVLIASLSLHYHLKEQRDRTMTFAVLDVIAGDDSAPAVGGDDLWLLSF